MAQALAADGHEVHVVPYRSRQAGLKQLAQEVAESLRSLGLASGGDEVGFVTHSMGGLVLRALPLALPHFRAGRSVCLGGPLNGAVLAQTVQRWPGVEWFHGPAFAELHPDAVAKLPVAPCEYASIAGTRWSPLLPQALVLARIAPGKPSDCTVLVEETRGPGCVAHAEVDEIHTFLPRNREVQRLTRRFLS
jgi:hypothetical protein